MSRTEIYPDSWISIKWTVTKRMTTQIPARGLAEFAAEAKLQGGADHDYVTLLATIRAQDAPARRTLLADIAEDWHHTHGLQVVSVTDVEITPTDHRSG
ncbi:hypothetical protein GCM10029978_067700 [Actinoallomurus acanthiterrae]